MTTPDEMVLAGLVAARAEQRPDHDVVTFENGARPDDIRSYAALWQNANRLAAALKGAGLEYGDRFAIMMRNHPEFIEALIAASLTGFVAVPIDPRTRGAKLAFTLSHSGCRGILADNAAAAAMSEVLADLPALEFIWQVRTLDEPAVEIPRARDIAEFLAAPVRFHDFALKSPSDPLQILYTSGTTGDPKGVVFENGRYGFASFLTAMLGVADDERPYTGLSLTHGNAQLMTLASALRLGQRAVFSRKFSKSRLWDITRKYQCTFFNLLGGMATAIYSEPERADDAKNPVKFVLSAGMPIGIWEKFERRFGVHILEAYGAVEGGIAFRPIGQGPIGSFGKPPAGQEMRVVDDNGIICPPYVRGELVSRPASGDAASVTYLHNPAASSSKTEGGWLRSGDICHADDNGWLFFDYRKGGGLRRNGDFVNPGFVEAALAECHGIDDVYVYGIDAPSGAPGEKEIVAAVVGPDGHFNAAAIFAHCRRTLDANAVPTLLQRVAEIPKTASEKPQDRFLIADLAGPGAELYAESGGQTRRVTLAAALALQAAPHYQPA